LPPRNREGVAELASEPVLFAADARPLREEDLTPDQVRQAVRYAERHGRDVTDVLGRYCRQGGRL
jgi:hypothetical protein